MNHRITIRAIGMAAMVGLGLHAVTAEAEAQTAVAGTYELIEVDGNAPPAVLEETENCTEVVTAASLELQEDGQWVMDVEERETCGDDVEEETETEEGRYTVQGSAIQFSTDDDETTDDDDADEDDAGEDDDDANEIELDELMSGTLDGSTLQVRVRDSDAVLVFQRV